MSTQNRHSQTARTPNRTPTTPGRQRTRERQNPSERVQQTFSAQQTNRLENLIDKCNSAFVTANSETSSE